MSNSIERELRITGEAVIMTPPDQVIISFPVEMKDGEYKQTLYGLRDKIEMLKSIIKENGIDPIRLKTTGLHINRNRVWDKKREEYYYSGYIAGSKLLIRLPMDTELTNSILSAIAIKSPDVEFSIGFSISSKKKFENELIKKAVKDAGEKAMVIAEAAGITLKEIIDIDYSFFEINLKSESEVVFSSALALESSLDFDYNPEDVELKKDITIKWRIE